MLKFVVHITQAPFWTVVFAIAIFDSASLKYITRTFDLFYFTLLKYKVFLNVDLFQGYFYKQGSCLSGSNKTFKL